MIAEWFSRNEDAIAEEIIERQYSLQSDLMVGGYPFNISSMLWQQVGADGFAPDAASSLVVSSRFVGANLLSGYII
jgi:methanogenic corrinoid protein MtbC1